MCVIVDLALQLILESCPTCPNFDSELWAYTDSENSFFQFLEAVEKQTPAHYGLLPMSRPLRLCTVHHGIPRMLTVATMSLRLHQCTPPTAVKKLAGKN